MKDLISGCIDPSGNFGIQGRSKDFTSIFLRTLFYCVWDYRNQKVHLGEPSFMKTVAHFEYMVEEFLVAHSLGETEKEPVEAWKPPPEGWLKVNTDAAFNGRKAAIAFTVRDELGKILKVASKLVTSESAFTAEVMAMEWATKEIEIQDLRKIIFSTDSLI